MSVTSPSGAMRDRTSIHHPHAKMPGLLLAGATGHGKFSPKHATLTQSAILAQEPGATLQGCSPRMSRQHGPRDRRITVLGAAWLLRTQRAFHAILTVAVRRAPSLVRGRRFALTPVDARPPFEARLRPQERHRHVGH